VHFTASHYYNSYRIHNIISSGSARADLSEEQKDKIRASLPSQCRNLYVVLFFARKGFDLTNNQEADSAAKRVLLDSSSNQGSRRTI
jgi:hypothetical protein